MNASISKYKAYKFCSSVEQNEYRNWKNNVPVLAKFQIIELFLSAIKSNLSRLETKVSLTLY